MEIDGNTLELLERQLSERIEKRVRTRLYWPLAVVVAVVGFFGYDVVTDMRDAAIRAAEERVQPALDGADAAVAEARAEVLSARSMLSTLTDWMADRTQKLSEVEDEVQGRVAVAAKTANDLQQTLDAVATRLDETEQRLRDQQNRAESMFAGAGNLSDLASELATLAEQVRALDAEFDRLAAVAAEPAAAGDGGEPAEAVRQSEDYKQALESVIQTSRAIAEQRPAEAAPAETVFIQIAGSQFLSGAPVPVSGVLAKGLGAAGYNVPGVEFIETAAGLHEVRYFFEDDRAAAERLAGAVNGLLAAAGFKDNVEVKDLGGYRGTKPKPGVLELWLDPLKL